MFSTRFCSCLGVLVVLCAARPASAEEATAESQTLHPNPGWATGLDVYGGLAVLSTGRRENAHSLVGGIARARWRYFQIGATLERTDLVLDRWTAVGGFVGGFLPFRRWVDFELNAGLSSRTYFNPDLGYGPNGYEFSSPALTFRFGVSDRSSDSLFGARLGAHLMTSIDLKRHEADFLYRVSSGDSELVFTGTTPVGGVSVGFLLVIGLEAGSEGR